MPTITAGGTPQTITLPEGQVLNVSGAAGAVGVVYRLNQTLGGTNSLESWAIGSAALSIGPFSGGQHFLLTCAAGSAVVSQSSAALNAPTFRTDGTAAGISQGGGPELSLAKLQKALPLIAFLGDSTFGQALQAGSTCTSLVYNGDGTATIGFGSPQGLVPGDDIGIQGANDGRYEIITGKVLSVSGNSYTYAIQGAAPTLSPDLPLSAVLRYTNRGGAAGPQPWADAFLGRRIHFENVSQIGDTGSKLLARFDVDVAPLRPDRVAVTFGANDCWLVYGGAVTVAGVLAGMQASAKALLAKCKAIGAAMDIFTPFPQNSGRAGWSTSGRDCYVQWRRWLIRWAAAEGLLVVDWATCTGGSVQVQNATDVNGNPTAGMNHSDLIHPQPPACMLAGRAYARLIAPIYGLPLSPRNISAITDSGLWLSTAFNGLFIGAGGTKVPGAGGAGTGADGAGPLAPGLTVKVETGAGVASYYQTPRTVAADGDPAGNWQGITLAAAAAGDRVSVAFPSLIGQIANGDLIRIQGQARLVGASLCKDLSISFVSQTAIAGNLLVSSMAAGTSQQSAYVEDFAYTLGIDAPVRATFNGYNPGAPTSFTPTLSFTAAAAGTFSLELAGWAPEKVN